MAYTAPTPAELKLRYAAFSAVSDVVVQYWLTDAKRFVTETWAEADYAPALMAHAAWQMSKGGLGAASGSAGLPAGVTRFRSGAMDVTIADSVASAAASGGVAAGIYESEFRALQRRNFAGPRVITAPASACCA